MLRRLALFAALAALSGCVPSEEQREAEFAEDQATCERLGVGLPHPGFRDCMMDLFDRREDRRSAFAGALANAGQAYSDGYESAAPAYRRSTTTTCYRLGNTLNCDTR